MNDCYTPWDTQSKRVYAVDGISPTLNSGGGQEGKSIQPAVLYAIQGRTAVIMDKEDGTMPTGYVVRRLTPLECERLQGFPDGWTDIKRKCVKAKEGYKAVEVDETPDTPRYRALGNSMAVPCMLWIGKRIQMVEDGEL